MMDDAVSGKDIPLSQSVRYRDTYWAKKIFHEPADKLALGPNAPCPDVIPER